MREDPRMDTEGGAVPEPVDPRVLPRTQRVPDVGRLPWDGRLRDLADSSDALVRGRAAGASRALGDAVSSLYGQSVDRVLMTPERVTSAAEGRALLASPVNDEALADQVQKVVALALAVLRVVARGARLTRVPWVLLASTSASVGLTVRAGVREVQVLGSLVAHRIEEATGCPADPALVKKVTVELYLEPKRAPDLSDSRLRPGRLVGRWVFRGALGRGTGKSASRALGAAERLDAGSLVDRWAELGARVSAPDRSDADTGL
jgi:hypothetical protein